MAENLKLARFYLLLLAIVTLGRWFISFKHVPYALGTDKLSIVTLTIYASIFYGAFCRRWRGFTLLQAVTLTALFGLFAQIVIFFSTLASYLLGLDTYFTNPKALQAETEVPMARAMLLRAQGLISGPVSNAIAGMLGWAMGGLLPGDRK